MKGLINLLLLLALLPTAAQGSQAGFIDCSDRKDRRFALAFEDFCQGHAATKLSCGEKVQVLKRTGPWLNILTTDDAGHYAGSKMYLPIRKSSPRSTSLRNLFPTAARYGLGFKESTTPASCSRPILSTRVRLERLVSKVRWPYH